MNKVSKLFIYLGNMFSFDNKAAMSDKDMLVKKVYKKSPWFKSHRIAKRLGVLVVGGSAYIVITYIFPLFVTVNLCYSKVYTAAVCESHRCIFMVNKKKTISVSSFTCLTA